MYLVTGGAGFIGRHLCAELIDAGHDVRVLDSLVEQAHRCVTDDEILRKVTFIRGDVRDSEAVKDAVAGADGVFHLASEVGVGQSMYEIERYVSANDLGTATLLQRIVQDPVKRIVVASSMSIYGEGLYAAGDGAKLDNVRATAPSWTLSEEATATGAAATGIPQGTGAGPSRRSKRTNRNGPTSPRSMRCPNTCRNSSR
jgi:dTDP-L-rhamnose 4-epimerase